METIAAISTPPGVGGIGIIRIIETIFHFECIINVY